MSKKILIIGPSWVGDMVMAQSLFIFLKKQDPSVTIDVLAPDWSRPMAERMPEVNEAIPMPIGHGKLGLLNRLNIARAMKKRGYDQAIVLPNSLKSALIPWLAGIPIRTGFKGEMRYGLLNDIRPLNLKQTPMMMKRYLILGVAPTEKVPDKIIYPQLVVSQKALSHVVKKFHLNLGKTPILVLSPGAEFGPAKRWPPKHFATIAKEKLAHGWQVWLVGSKRDESIANEIQLLTDNQCLNFTGVTTLGEAIDLIHLSTAVISNDSGLMHITSALNKPLIVVYGSTDPRIAPPFGPYTKSLYLGLDCSPCAKRTCPLGHHHCMEHITPKMMLNALDEILKQDFSSKEPTSNADFQS